MFEFKDVLYKDIQTMFSNNEYKALSKKDKANRLKEIASVFLKLGAFSFGGPAAHIAMMDDEIVKKRSWLSREKFVDLLGATNLIPGPNSTELAIHLGYARGGLLGLLIAGAAFILPAVLIVLVFAVLYASYGALPEVSSILYGIKPVIMAIIVQALYRLSQTVLKTKTAALLCAAVVALSLLGLHEILLLFLAGGFMLLLKNWEKIRTKLFSLSVLPLGLPYGSALQTAKLHSLPMDTLFLTFLKIGSVLYGSGYVLLAFLEAEFVERFAVLTNQQLMDAIAVGQFTPGPVFTTATFVGYLINGFEGALLATVGIFLPAFVLVFLLNPIMPKLRASSWVSGALDGINVASLGLMAVVSLKLGISSFVDLVAVLLFLASFFVLMKFKLNSVWLIAAGGFVGWAAQAVAG